MCVRKYAQKIEITTLIDNYSDIFLPSSNKVQRWSIFKENQREERNPFLYAEHGFSLLITINNTKIIYDAGASANLLIKNLKLMKIDPNELDVITISHGHLDHTGAIESLIRKIDKAIPVILHPETSKKYFFLFPNGNRTNDMIAIDKKRLEDSGARVIENTKPYEVAEGCFLSGFIPRTNKEEKGLPFAYIYKDEGYEHDAIIDEQAIYIDLKNKGLVIITGCGHAGIVNTIMHAQNIMGTKKIYAIIGGLHLSQASEELVDWTIKNIKDFEPKIVVPTHCTGFNVMMRFSLEMPNEFILNSVGSTFNL